MIGLLRFVGVVNAAIWFGATAFFAFGAIPLLHSSEMRDLLSAKNFPYFSEVINQMLSGRLFHWYVACSIVALVHLVAEWLYLGKYPQRAWLALLLGLCLAGVVQIYAIQPRLAELHRLQYTRPDLREAAARSFRAWQTVSGGLDLVLVCGLVLYLWRVANPPDATRFVSASKFRS